MVKKLILLIVVYVAIMLFLYACVVFINLQPNPSNWSYNGRKSFILMANLIAVFPLAIIVSKYKK